MMKSLVKDSLYSVFESRKKQEFNTLAKLKNELKQSKKQQNSLFMQQAFRKKIVKQLDNLGEKRKSSL